MAMNNATIFSAQVSNYFDESLLEDSTQLLLICLEHVTKSAAGLDGKTKHPGELKESIRCLRGMIKKIKNIQTPVSTQALQCG